MRNHLTSHLPRCNPASPCSHCKLQEFLRKHLSEYNYEDYVKRTKDLVREWERLYEPKFIPSGIDLDTSWKPMFEKASYRLRSCITNERCETIRDIVTFNQVEWMRVPNLGKISLNEMEEILARNGLFLKDSEK